MKKARIRLTGMTIATIFMIAAVFLTFPVKYVEIQGKNTVVLISRIYRYRTDTDYVLLSDGKALYLKDVKEKDMDKIYGRILISGMEGFM